MAATEHDLLLPDLIDTSILVHYVRGDALAVEVESRLSLMSGPHQPLISVITEGEIHSLALQFGWGDARRERLRRLLDQALIVPLDFEGVVAAYARIDAHCRRIGALLGENDTWIAATAHAAGARLVTTDTDFRRLDPEYLTHEWVDPRARR